MGLPFAKFGLEAKNLAERQAYVYFKVLADEHPIIGTPLCNGSVLPLVQQRPETQVRLIDSCEVAANLDAYGTDTEPVCTFPAEFVELP
jgi:hypothetical protein